MYMYMYMYTCTCTLYVAKFSAPLYMYCTCTCNSFGQLTHCFRVTGHIISSASFSHNIKCLLMVSCVFVHVCVSVQRLRRESVGYGGQADEDNMDSYQPLGQGKHMPIYMYMYIHVHI